MQRLKFKVFRHSERSYQHNIMKIKCQSCFNNNIRVWRCAEVWIFKQWKQWRTIRKTIELLNWAQFPQPEAGNFNTFIYLLRKIDTIKDQSSNNLSPRKMPWSCGFDEERFMVLMMDVGYLTSFTIIKRTFTRKFLWSHTYRTNEKRRLGKCWKHPLESCKNPVSDET